MSAAATSTAVPVASALPAALEQVLPDSLKQLAKQLEDRPYALAASEGDGEIAQTALEATKGIFDLAISLESISHNHLHPFLLSILEPPSINTRSSTKAKAATEASTAEEATDPELLLPYTPLSLLTVDGLDPEQVWAQLELRTEGIANVIKAVGPGEQDMGDEMDDQMEEDGSDEEMTVDEFRRMLIEAGEEGVEDMSDEELIQLMEEDDDSEDESDDSDDSDEEGFSFKDEEGISDEDDEEGSDEDDEDEDEDDEEMDGLSGESDLEVSGEEEDDEDEDEDDAMEEDDDEDDADAMFGAGPSQPSKRKKHPTLDDDFFSIDEFNRLTEEAEAGRVSSGRLGGDDDDDDDDLGDVGSMMLKGADEDDEITYADFFEAPRGATSQSKGKSKAGAKGKGKGKGKSKSVSFNEEEDGEMEEDDAEEEVDQARGVSGRVKGDLFDDESDEEQDEQTLSTHEKRQLAIAKQIAELEQEAIGPKDWTLLGEASSRARPENSLLEENLDFEQVGKVVPVITEESVKSLEDMIKQRILDSNYDSPVRVRAYEPTPFLPSRYFELQDTQSNKSLAQIYEEEYQAAATGGKAKDPRDEKLKKEHEEIERLWGDVCYKLDALSSLNFVPKQPKAQITTISDLPTTSMESALPPTSAASTMLAPQELFAAPKASELVARTELTPEEAQRARSKVRREKKGERKRLGDMAELYGKKKKSVTDQKDEALQGLVKSGKGVTVVGKGAGGKDGKGKRKPNDDAPREDGKRLKL